MQLVRQPEEFSDERHHVDIFTSAESADLEYFMKISPTNRGRNIIGPYEKNLGYATAVLRTLDPWLAIDERGWYPTTYRNVHSGVEAAVLELDVDAGAVCARKLLAVRDAGRARFGLFNPLTQVRMYAGTPQFMPSLRDLARCLIAQSQNFAIVDSNASRRLISVDFSYAAGSPYCEALVPYVREIPREVRPQPVR